MENEVYAVSIELTNVRNIPHGELRLGKREPGQGQLIVIKGDNATGKSNFLYGIRSIFTGGHDPKVIADGEKKAEMRMLLSDTTDIKRVVTRKGQRLEITTAESDTPVKAPETFVKRLASGVGFDPLIFLRLKKEDRLKYLLTVMDLNFTATELMAAMGKAIDFVPLPVTDAALSVASWDIRTVNSLTRDLTEKRAAIGSKRDEKAESVEAWRKLLLTSDQGATGKNWKTELSTLEAKRLALEKREREDVGLIERQLKEVRSTVGAAIQLAEDAVREEFGRLLNCARSGMSPDDDNKPFTDLSVMAALAFNLDELSTQKQALFEAERDAQSAIDKTRADSAALLQTLSGEIGTAKTGFESQAKSDGIREEMEKFRKEARKLGEDWDTIAAAIKELEILRRAKLKNLPLEGLEVREDGEILMNGREIDEMNTGAQYMTSMMIGALGAGALGLLVADDTVHLGPELWEEFKAAVKASPLTVVCTRLSTEDEIEEFGPGLRSEPSEALVLA